MDYDKKHFKPATKNPKYVLIITVVESLQYVLETLAISITVNKFQLSCIHNFARMFKIIIIWFNDIA